MQCVECSVERRLNNQFYYRYILPKEASGEKKEEESGASEGADSTSEPPQKKQKFTGKFTKYKLMEICKEFIYLFELVLYDNFSVFYFI